MLIAEATTITTREEATSVRGGFFVGYLLSLEGLPRGKQIVAWEGVALLVAQALGAVNVHL